MMIFLPVRNGGAHLSSAIGSIRAQTSPDWRLVVLDNHSTDDTVARVHETNDPRIFLETSAETLSITQSWERILPIAAALPSNQIMTLIGHDDLFKPDFVASVLQLALDFPEATLYQTQLELIDTDGLFIRSARPIPVREEAEDLIAALCWGIRDSFGTGYAFRAGDYTRVGGIPALPRLLYADHLLFSRLTALGNKRSTTSIGCSYRLHQGSASNGISGLRLSDHALALEQFVAAIEENDKAFSKTDRGRMALINLLDRELMILEARGVGSALSSDGRAAVARLQARLTGGAGRPTLEWTPRSGKPFLNRVRQWRVTARLLLQRIGNHA